MEGGGESLDMLGLMLPTLVLCPCFTARNGARKNGSLFLIGYVTMPILRYLFKTYLLNFIALEPDSSNDFADGDTSGYSLTFIQAIIDVSVNVF